MGQIPFFLHCYLQFLEDEWQEQVEESYKNITKKYRDAFERVAVQKYRRYLESRGAGLVVNASDADEDGDVPMADAAPNSQEESGVLSVDEVEEEKGKSGGEEGSDSEDLRNLKEHSPTVLGVLACLLAFPW